MNVISRFTSISNKNFVFFFLKNSRGGPAVQSVLLASVSPTMFVAMGAASASVLLVAVLLAAIYLRRVRKRSSGLMTHQLTGGGGSLRSSLHLHSELEYTEKLTGGGHNGGGSSLAGCDSYATLASFTKVSATENNYSLPGAGAARRIAHDFLRLRVRHYDVL
jgi:hypothetical protein